MAEITLSGNPIHTAGNLPEKGSAAPDFTLTGVDLGDFSLEKFAGKNVVLNIFPSIDTGICAMSTRRFNKEAQNLDNTVVVCVSKDLPFAQKRFCGAEGLDNVIMGSELRNSTFSDNYNVKITDGPMAGLHSRAVVVIDKDRNIVHSEQVPEIVQEPDYEAAIASLK